MELCKKCKKPLPKNDDHKCERCSFRICRTCDDHTELLEWVDMGEDKPDQYVCYKCRGVKRTKKSKPERVEEKQATADNA
jgi:hypothetical protein